MIDYMKIPSTDYLTIILNEQNDIEQKEISDKEKQIDNTTDFKIELRRENNDKMDAS
jgi:hypothetical protein